MQKRRLVPLAMVVALAGCGPIGQMPGLAIGGEERAAPDSFAFVQDHDLIQIRTLFGGWLPQVHHIWGVSVDDSIYAIAVPGASWRERIADDPNVLLRVGEAHYKLTAASVNDASEKQRVFDAYIDKYGPQLEEILGRPGTIEDMSDMLRFTSS
jgi:hypothetical protein